MTRSSQLLRTPGIEKQGIHTGGVGVDAIEIALLPKPQGLPPVDRRVQLTQIGASLW